ncbi:MAG: RHS repeat protein, partial [Lentisphaerae bacterium]|nr:RHS repeat protein [Lentisphaerota bacterium]
LTQCAATRYSYALFAAGDFLSYNDRRPRTVVNEICGVEVSRTYHAYPTNALGQAQIIVERAGFPGAPYGHAANPRTVKTYYAANAALPLPGRLATVVYPGGKTETCGYEYGTFNAAAFAFTPDPDGGAWRETVTTSYGVNSGVQALRSARIWDEKGTEVLNESYVEDGASFARIGWTRMTYDRNGKLIETAYSDGRVVSATWGANCCGKESETAADGTITVYGYNLLKQKVSETKKGMAADGSEDITTFYAYDLANRVLSAAVTNIASGLGYVASRNAYDTVGRATNAVDRLGNTTATAYAANGTVTVRLPNGVVRMTEKYGDGRAKLVSEDNVVRQAHAYGMTPDGQRWTLSAKGALPSIGAVKTAADLRSLASALDCPWTLVFQDSVGQPAVSMRPGFGRTVLVASNAYDAAGNILSVTETACRPDGTGVEWVKSQLYAYAADGSRLFSAFDLNTNGVIDVAGPDRINGTAAVYEKAGADWWQVARSWVYPEFNSSAAVTTSVRRVLFTGLGVQRGNEGVLVSHVEELDVRGNATVSETLVDRADRKVTRVNALPTSVQPEIQVAGNGLLLKTVSSTAVTNTFGYDALARQTASTDGRGNTTVTAYNPQGLVAYTEDAATNRTTYGYDFLGRRTEVTDAMGNVTRTQYDADNRVVAQWGATYPVAYAYDVQGRMVQMGTCRGVTEITDYAVFQSLVSGFDKTRWLYDNPTGLLTNKLYADGLGPAYTYTPDGKLATRLWARLDPGTGGKLLTRYSYDAAGSLLGVDYSDATPDIAYTFNRIGQMLSAVSSVSTNQFTYSTDTLELLSETQNGSIIARLTDAQGRPSGLTLGDDYEILYGCDSLGRFASVSSSVQSVSFVGNYSHLPGSDLISGYTVGPLTVTKTYEPHRDLITQVRNETFAGVISQYDYVSDALGRRVSRQDSGLAFARSLTNSFSYNQRSEVVGATLMTSGTNDRMNFSYAYDPIGNRRFSSSNSETNTYAANALNQYSNIILQAYSPQPDSLSPLYDADGNMTFDGKEWHYVWNGENRLILASNDTHVVTYAYDHQGRMVWKTIFRVNAPPVKAIAYVLDDYNIIAEHITTNGITEITYNVWGLDLSGTVQGAPRQGSGRAGGVGGLLSVTTTDADQPNSLTTYYPSYDGNGNITEYIDADGTLAAHREYSSFGEMLVLTGAFVDSFTFWWSTKPY